MASNNVLSSRALSTTRVFVALAMLPLLLVALSGLYIFFDLYNQTHKEAIAHTKNSVKLLSNRTSAFIANRVHSAQLLAGEQAIRNHLSQTSQISAVLASEDLQRYCKTLSASICYVMDTSGLTIADNLPPEKSVVGNNYGFRPYFKNAMQGKASVLPALGVTTKKRGLYFSSPVYQNDTIIGAAIIKFSPDQIEQSFTDLSGKVSLVDENGIVFASSEPDWIFKSLFPLEQATQKEIINSRQFGDKAPVSILRPTDDLEYVQDRDGNPFVYNLAQINELPGWNIVYLLAPDHFILPHQQRKQTLFMTTVAIFFFVVLLVVSKLFLNLKRVQSKNDTYRLKLEESTERLQQFEEVTTEAIIIRDRLRILDVNKRTEELLGMPRTLLLNAELSSLCSNDSAKKTTKLLSEASEKPFQAELITHSGELLPVVITDRPTTWNGKRVNVTSLRDERRHKAVQKKLLASEGRFRQLSDLVADGILIYAEQVIVDVNHSFCNIIGERREDLIGISMSEIFPAEVIELFKATDFNLMEHEVELHRRDGTLFPAEINSASMQFDESLYTVLSIRDITRQKEQEEHILYQAQYDLLTHIPNRFLARDRAEHAIANAMHNGNKMLLMFIDLDGFKKVNDSLGHDVGDRLLQLSARRFKACIEENHTLARHGGDEFLIIMEDITTPEDAEVVLEEILDQFSKPFVIDSKELIVTASIGVAVYPDDATDYPSLLRAADIGMYKAKKDGRNTFHYYTQEMNDIAIRQLQLDNNLRTALERGEFHLAYQPLVRGCNNGARIVGAEALLRWDSEELGSVSPVEFIPLTENTGLIIPIGRWILEQACIQANKWISSGFKEFKISVNVSPRQFKGNDFIKDLDHALEVSGLPPKHLKLEVTEGLLIQASPELNKTLSQISQKGVKISMDDFGTGYSSLSYLQTFPFNNLKIDRAFIRGLPQHEDSKILVSAIIAMAHKLGLTVTAEGIETIEQFNYVQSIHCDYLQGFYFGKPVDSDKFTQQLTSQGIKLVT